MSDYRQLTCLLLLSVVVTGQSQPPPERAPAESEGLQSVKPDAEIGKGQTSANLKVSLSESIEEHPDVRVAKAEVQLAQEKLAQVRADVAQRLLQGEVATQLARGKVTMLESSLAIAQKEYERAKSLVVGGEITGARLAEYEDRVAQLRQQVFAANLEWSSLKDQQTKLGHFNLTYDSKQRITKVYPIGDLKPSVTRIVELLKPNDARDIEIEVFQPNQTLVITAGEKGHEAIEAKLSLLRRLESSEVRSP